MPLIDRTYFIGEINIPGTDRTEIQERLDLFIKKYEDRLLLDLFGYELSKGFTAGLLVTPPIDPIWIRLKDGYEYSDMYGRLTKWLGLINTSEKRSLIANYVYYFWMRDQTSQSVGLGEVATKAENAIVVSPRYKMIKAWNEMVDQIRLLRLFLDHPDHIYPGWNTWYSYGLYNNYRPINDFGI